MEQKVMPDDHSEVVPLLPIPNRTVKRFCANDSADSRVKVGHRQALIARKAPVYGLGLFFGQFIVDRYLLNLHHGKFTRGLITSRL